MLSVEVAALRPIKQHYQGKKTAGFFTLSQPVPVRLQDFIPVEFLDRIDTVLKLAEVLPSSTFVKTIAR